jgi:hypothetical protein
MAITEKQSEAIGGAVAAVYRSIELELLVMVAEAVLQGSTQSHTEARKGAGRVFAQAAQIITARTSQISAAIQTDVGLLSKSARKDAKTAKADQETTDELLTKARKEQDGAAMAIARRLISVNRGMAQGAEIAYLKALERLWQS